MTAYHMRGETGAGRSRRCAEPRPARCRARARSGGPRRLRQRARSRPSRLRLQTRALPLALSRARCARARSRSPARPQAACVPRACGARAGAQDRERPARQVSPPRSNTPTTAPLRGRSSPPPAARQRPLSPSAPEPLLSGPRAAPRRPPSRCQKLSWARRVERLALDTAAPVARLASNFISRSFVSGLHYVPFCCTVLL